MIEDQRRAEEESLRHKQEVVAKRREKREHVIEETLQTERDFLRSISICFDVFHDPSKGQSSIVSMFEKLQLLAVTQIQVYKVSTVMNANLIIFGHRTFVCDSRRSWTCGSCLATSNKLYRRHRSFSILSKKRRKAKTSNNKRSVPFANRRISTR